MIKKEILSFIFLAELYNEKKDCDILLEISNNEVSGKIVDGGNFIYTIGEKEKVIPISRIWNYFLSQVKGKTKSEYLKNLNKLLQKYPFPKEVLTQLKFINPETNELEYYDFG